jgi:acetyl-CoA carboxylase alpha subunit
MKKNLTLRINEDLVEFAHNFSQETNQSISHMIEKYLSELKKIQEQSIKDKEVSKRIEKLYGAFESNKIPDKQNF